VWWANGNEDGFLFIFVPSNLPNKYKFSGKQNASTGSIRSMLLTTETEAVHCACTQLHAIVQPSYPFRLKIA
jgi:hypothetical protein